jgi:Holliday junction resolvasome RuvABC endonuclease subunit
MKFKLSLPRLEKALGFKLRKNVFVLSFDTATTTGIVKMLTDGKTASFETSTVKLPDVPEDIEDKAEKYEERLDMLLTIVRDFKKTLDIKKDYTILVLENSYAGKNVYGYGFLKGFMGLLYAEFYDVVDHVDILFASQARKAAGFKSSIPKKHGMKPSEARKKRKAEIVAWVSQILGKDIENDDEADALILAFAGAKEK